MIEPSDAELLAAARRGEADATTALITRHAARVLRFARGLCANPVDADDASQDALIAAYHGIANVRSAEGLPSWLYAVTRSACSRQRRRLHPGDIPLDEGPTVATPEGGPEHDAARREVAGALTQALRGLDPKYREVVWLRDVEGLTAPEVAESLDLDVAAVKTRLHRGRAQVRTRMEPVLAMKGAGAACPDIVERFSAYLEGEIGTLECDALKAHVESCASCNAACEALKRTVGLCNSQAKDVPADLQARVKQALLIATGKNVIPT